MKVEVIKEKVKYLLRCNKDNYLNSNRVNKDSINLQLVKDNPYIISIINDPVDEVILEALRQDGRLLMIFPFPNDKMLSAAAESNIFSLTLCNVDNSDFVLSIIDKYPMAIQTLNNLSKSILLSLVFRNPLCILFLHNPPKKLIDLAFRINNDMPSAFREEDTIILDNKNRSFTDIQHETLNIVFRNIVDVITNDDNIYNYYQ